MAGEAALNPEDCGVRCRFDEVAQFRIKLACSLHECGNCLIIFCRRLEHTMKKL